MRCLGRVRLNLYAHQRYIERFGLPKDANDLDGYRFVAPHREDRRLPFWPWVEECVQPQQIVLSSPDIWVNIDAIARGLGMGFLADPEAATRPNLTPVLSPSRLWFVRLWIVTHVDLPWTAKVQAMPKLIKSKFDGSSKPPDIESR